MTAYLDVSSFYESACEHARRAVATSGGGNTYGLLDVASEDAWYSLMGSGVGALAIAATLDGATKGLRERGSTAADVLDYPDDVLRAGAVTEEDVNLARGWVADVLGQDLDTDASQRLVTAALAARGWQADSTRITSLVLAVVSVSAHAADYRR